MGRKLTAALLAALMLCTAALAAEPPEPPAGEEVIREEEIREDELREEPGEELELPAGEEPGEEIELPAGEEELGEELEGWFEADLIQAGSLTGPQTMPDGFSMFALNEESVKNAIYEGLKAKSESIDLRAYNVPQNDIFDLYDKTVNDHPELFYVHTGCGYSYNSSTNYVTTLSPTYHDGKPVYSSNGEFLYNTKNLKSAEAQAKFDTEVDKALAQVDGSMTDVEKALVLHDYLVVNCKYNWEVGDTNRGTDMTVYSAYGALVEKDPVCQGYALAYKYLLNQAGITAVTLSSNAMHHMWNQVYVNDKWYHVDVTHDDPFPDMEGKCYHDNFLRSDTGITSTGHEGWDSSAYPCDDDSYSTSLILKATEWPLYWADGGFYWVELKEYMTYGVYHGGLTDEEQTWVINFDPLLRVESGSYYPDSFGLVWLDGYLYYIGRDSKLHGLSLAYGQEALSQNTVTFVPQDSGGRTDFMGLRYRNGVLQATSRTRYDAVLAVFAPVRLDYPPAWNEAGNGICGLTSDSTKAGIKWDGPGDAVLYAVSLENGRMTGVQVLPAALRNGVTLVDLPKAVGSQWKLILASGDGASPLCGAQSGGN